MTEDTQAPENQAPDTQAQSQPQQAANPTRVDPAFFTCVNEYLELTSRQSKQQGPKRISLASLYAAARFNAHVYLASAGAKAAQDRAGFLDYMGTLYRRMLNEHLDGLGAERGVEVGVSELAAEYEARGYKLPDRQPDTPVVPAGDDKAG